MRKIILIIGDDRMGRQAMKSVHATFPDMTIYRNRSGSPRRILKLVRKRILSFSALMCMAWAELRRQPVSTPDFPVLLTNQHVREMLEREKPDMVICFRAGLVLTEKTLAYPTQFLNLHYADLPKWAGLGTIAKALKAKAYHQNACLHEMVGEIDAGEVYHREAYTLDPSLGYKANEDRAFEAGLRLLHRYLSGEVSS